MMPQLDGFLTPAGSIGFADTPQTGKLTGTRSGARAMTSNCSCPRTQGRRFQGDAPERHVELVEEQAWTDWPPRWRLRCPACQMRWLVSYIPGGGIYGDFDWARLDEPG